MKGKNAESESEILHWDFGRDVAQMLKLQIGLLLSYLEKTVKTKKKD